MNSIKVILLINVIILFSGVATDSPEEEKPCYFKEETINCCKGFVLQVLSQTAATCVKCLGEGEPCYKTTQPCCPTFRCGSGGISYPEPRAGDRCISDSIRG